jgi:hypothetical protein
MAKAGSVEISSKEWHSISSSQTLGLEIMARVRFREEGSG